MNSSEEPEAGLSGDPLKSILEFVRVNDQNTLTRALPDGHVVAEVTGSWDPGSAKITLGDLRNIAYNRRTDIGLETIGEPKLTTPPFGPLFGNPPVFTVPGSPDVSGKFLVSDPEPAAWSYELATTIEEGPVYGGWKPFLTKHRPNVPEGSVRNLVGLYPKDPGFGGPAAADPGEGVRTFKGTLAQDLSQREAGKPFMEQAYNRQAAFYAYAFARDELRELALRIVRTVEKTLSRRVSGVEMLDKEEQEKIVDRALDKFFEGRNGQPAAGLSDEEKEEFREALEFFETNTDAPSHGEGWPSAEYWKAMGSLRNILVKLQP